MSEPARTSAAPEAPQLRACLDAIHAVRDEAVALAAGATDAQFDTRPGPDRWSAAECYDHLVVSARLQLPNLEAAIHAARARGRTARGPFRYGPFSRWMIRAMQPGAPRMKSPKPMQPSVSGLDKETVVRAFVEVQDALVRCIREADGLDLKRVLVPSGAMPLVRFSLGAWFEITAAHERRHLLQARRALEAAGSGSGGG